jgi:multidrug efflux pump subunit AcrB
MPLALISGGSGEFLKSLGQVLALALLSSWLIAIVIIPAFCYWFMPAAKTVAGQAPAVESYDGKAYRIYRRFLVVILRARLVFVALMIGLLISSMLIFKFIKQRSLGPSERNQFTAYVDLPAEASIGETIRVVDQVNAYLLDPAENPEVTSVLGYVGSGGPRFFLALSPNDAQPNKGFLVVNTQEPDQIEEVMERLDRYFVTDVPEAQGRCDILFLGGSPLGTVEYMVSGPELATLRRLKADVKAAFHSVDDIRSVRDNWENAVLKVRVEIDQERARLAAVSSQDIASTLSAYFDGEIVTTYREGELSIPVAFRSRAEDRGDLDRVRTVEIRSANGGAPVPLLQVADFEGRVEPSRIRRVDQERTISIMGKHPDMTAIELNAILAAKIEAIDVPRGYSIELGGEITDSEESNQKLFKYAPHAMFIIVLLLVLQFNSFRRPGIILSTIPLVLIGANYGLLVFRGYFDFTAMLGLFSLAGIIINNGIVLIDRIDQGRAEGDGVGDAVVDAALARSRPIIMTTVTTIVGLIPMALFGGEFWYGMSIVIMCGIGVGSLLTLGFVPVMYSLLFDFTGRQRAKAAA